MTQPDSPRPHRTARQCRAALAAVLLVLAPGAGWALADAGPPAELDQPGERQGDPRLHKLQILLSELELYRGPIDGQPRPAATAALLQFAQSAQLPPTGELSDELFDQLEAAVRLRRLTRFLMNLGREQSDQARAALLSQPSTRDLVAPGASSGPAAPNAAPGAVFACVRAPQASCLVAAAVEAGDAVEEVKLRDWALSEIVKAQARSGIDDGARASIRRMTDARQIIVSLRDLAAIQAERRDADAALATARSIPETLARVDAALAIASRQIETGDRDPAAATMALAATG